MPKATEIVIALEKIVAAQPGSAAPEPTVLDRDFSARRTRIETIQTGDVDRVLILKLDHLGDFIMSLPALERARALFYDSHITLVVGSWNESLARESGFADTVLVFDAFPRNSSEEKVDLVGKTALFAQTIRGPFDLAIDLRTDPDTRFYLQHVEAAARAGLGTRAQFPYLDVFLPIDVTRHEPETAREDVLQPHQFFAQPFCTRSHFRIYCSPENVTDKFGAVIWGPYRRLRPGRYFFEPFLEFDSPAEGLLLIDVALNMERKVAKAISASSTLRIAFDVEQSAAEFEFRIHEPHDGRPIGFNFYGGRLVREGADSVLHQSEYQVLLLELIAMRLMEHGLRRELRGLL